MNREQLEDAVYAKYDKLDMSDIESLTDNQLHEMLGHTKRAEPEDPVKKGRSVKIHKAAIEKLGFDYVEHLGRLHRVEHFSAGASVRVLCGKRVQFEGRMVAASIVLHWLRTGELVKRVPRVPKIKAAIRVGKRVFHLGRFETREELQAAKDAAKFRILMGLPPIG